SALCMSRISYANRCVYFDRHVIMFMFFFSSRRRHTRFSRDWSSDVCSSDLCRDRRRTAAADGGDAGPRRLGALAAGGGDRSADEIGRASCRERVESSDVAAWLTAKVRQCKNRDL